MPISETKSLWGPAQRQSRPAARPGKRAWKKETPKAAKTELERSTAASQEGSATGEAVMFQKIQHLQEYLSDCELAAKPKVGFSCPNDAVNGEPSTVSFGRSRLPTGGRAPSKPVKFLLDTEPVACYTL